MKNADEVEIYVLFTMQRERMLELKKIIKKKGVIDQHYVFKDSYNINRTLGNQFREVNDT